MPDPTDVQRLVQQLMAGASPEESRALLEGLMSGQVSSLLERLRERPEPTLRPVPEVTTGFRVRLDLDGAKPPVWRRLDVPGDLTLPALHDVLQAAMGWSHSHLHRFRTAKDHRAPYFITEFDQEEGEDGLLEDGIRLDQVLGEKGDELWYEYDFGDGWDHRVVVEAVLDERPARATCVAGRLACPPEDCGGMGGYADLAAWVRSGYDDALLPGVFDDAAQAREWLPLEWHPDHFDVEETDATLVALAAEPVDVVDELTELADELERRGTRRLRTLLSSPLSHHGPTAVSDAEAARLTATYRTFLDLVGDGVALTGAGYLPPALVKEIADATGISGWWIGKANREDQTFPVADVRNSARALGLVTVRNRRLAPTAAARRCDGDPVALWHHIVARLPLGTKPFERHAGWMALAVVGSGAPAQTWRSEISDLLFALGWSAGRGDPPSPNSPTLDVLELLAGATRERWGQLRGVDFAVSATARAAIRRT